MNIIDLVTDTLRNCTVIGQTATPSAEQGADAVTKLNDLMASLEEDGIDFGYNPKATTAEAIELPLGQVSTIKALLGVALCDGYGIPPPVVVATTAASGYQRLLRQAIYANAVESTSDAPAGENNPYRWNILYGP